MHTTAERDTFDRFRRPIPRHIHERTRHPNSSALLDHMTTTDHRTALFLKDIISIPLSKDSNHAKSQVGILTQQSEVDASIDAKFQVGILQSSRQSTLETKWKSSISNILTNILLSRQLQSGYRTPRISESSWRPSHDMMLGLQVPVSLRHLDLLPRSKTWKILLDWTLSLNV
jgi:hypothetical protein